MASAIPNDDATTNTPDDISAILEKAMNAPLQYGGIRTENNKIKERVTGTLNSISKRHIQLQLLDMLHIDRTSFL
jgi:hypothetical protein